MPSVKLNLSPLGKVKLALHAVQAVLVFIALIVFIAMGTRAGDSKGAGIYYLVLTLLTVPALIYLAAVPMWQRTKKLANAFAFLAVDLIFTILWLAAWAAVVAWVRSGINSGAEKAKVSGGDANCTTFDKDFGTPAKCKLGNACVGVGVTLFVLFIPTAVISFLFIRKSRNSPDTPQPWLGTQHGKGGEYAPADDMEGGKDNAWSTEMQDDTGYGGAGGGAHNDNPYDRPHSPGSEHGGHHAAGHHDTDNDDDEYELLQGAGAHGQGPAGHEFGPSASNSYRPGGGYSSGAGGYTVQPEDRLDDDSEYYGSGGNHNVYGYSHDNRTDADLPPYPSTPYGGHAEPYGGGAHDSRPYSDRR